jgi:hypothetical protein
LLATTEMHALDNEQLHAVAGKVQAMLSDAVKPI